MVGVPGRSKGCHTCRKRKKKCDLQRPTCDNCTRGKFICGGYDQNMIIIQVGQNGKGTYQRQTQKAPSQSVQPVASLADVHHKEFNRTTLEIACFASFSHLLTPPVTTNLSKQPPWANGLWTPLLQLAAQSDIVRCAFLSASAFQIGHENRDGGLRNKGGELYGQGIRQMSRAIDPSRLGKRGPGLFELEMAGYGLALYEFFRQEVPTIKDQQSSAARFRMYYDRDQIRFSTRYKGHVGGLMQLIRLQDPEVFSEPSRHGLFLLLRQIWLPQLLEMRRSTFLSSPEWLTKPWKGLQKKYYDTMWDAMTMLPGMLEAWENLKSASPGCNTDHDALMLRRRCYELETMFLDWHNNLSTACPSFDREEADELRKQIDELPIEELPKLLMEHGIWYISAWMNHWAGRIIIYSSAALIYSSYPPGPDEPIIIASRSIGAYCLSIARSAVLFFDPKRHTGLLAEMALRVNVAVAQRALSNPVLRATGDPLLKEADSILQGIGREELAAELRKSGEDASTHKKLIGMPAAEGGAVQKV